MLIKSFKIGHYWDHGMRVRETTMGENMSVCPLSLLYKDHKGWSPDHGTAPPTRPVVGGHLGINLHISEIVSDILDPVITTYRGGREIISTEDLIAKAEILSEEKRRWSRDSYWGGIMTREFRACEDCSGEDEYVWDPEQPEVCTCDDGIDEEGRMMVTKGCMKKMRRGLWEEQYGWSMEDE